MYQQRANRPTFNVFEPHEGVTVVTMNDEMRNLIRSFIGEVEVEEVETEIRAFMQALTDPAKSRRLRAEKQLAPNARQVSALGNAIVTSCGEQRENYEEPEERPSRGSNRRFQPQSR